MNKEKVENFLNRLQKDARSSGYSLNPDKAFTKVLVEGLLVNEERYGYQSCPCRLASGDEKKDLDIVCPCDYRDLDLDYFGACYCALYVHEGIRSIKKKVKAIPDRRFQKENKNKTKILHI